MRPYLRAANVDWDGLKLDDVKEMNFSDAELAVYRLEAGDLLLNEASGSPDEVGKPALWDGSIEDCCFQNTLIRVRSQGPDVRFLLHFFGWQALSGAFASASRGVGIHHIGSGTLVDWPMQLPPLAEQRRIVEAVEDHLSRIDAGLIALDAAERKLFALRRSLLVDVRRRALDSGSSLRQLGEIAETALGKMLDAKNARGTATPYLRNIHVRWGRVETSDVRSVQLTAGERQRFSLASGDLLVCEGGEPGRCAVWRGGDDSLMAFQKALHRVRPNPGVNADWIALMLEEAVVSRRTDHLLTGTTIKHLPQQKLRLIELPVPSEGEQCQFVKGVGSAAIGMERLHDELSRDSHMASALRESVLRSAFAGRLVCQDQSEEPASALLERLDAERAAVPDRAHRRTYTRPGNT
jgi:type I restriction enzyme S subunit